MAKTAEDVRELVDMPIEKLIALQGDALSREAKQEDERWQAVAAALTLIDTRLSKVERLLVALEEEMDKAGIPVLQHPDK